MAEQGLTYNDETVTSVRYEVRGRGNIDTYRADLELRNGERVVARLENVDIDEEREAIGTVNAMKINRSGNAVGTLGPDEVRPHAGHGPAQGREQNTVERETNAPDAKTPDPAEIARRQGIRDALAEEFEVKGDAYRFRDGDRSVAVRETSSGKIVSSSNDPRAARAAAQIADANGHSAITVDGHRDFRREAWIEATARGLDVTGYKAQEVDREESRRRAAERIVAERNVVEPADPGVRREPVAEPEPSAARRAVEHAATAYTASRTTTVDAAVRLAERLRVGIDDRERSQTLPPVHNPKHVRDVEQEIPTP